MTETVWCIKRVPDLGGPWLAISFMRYTRADAIRAWVAGRASAWTDEEVMERWRRREPGTSVVKVELREVRAKARTKKGR